MNNNNINSDYIAISDLNDNSINDNNNFGELNIEGVPIYQIQYNTNQNTIKIVNIGILPEAQDIIINKFEINGLNFLILNCLYDKINLSKLKLNAKYEIIKIVISDNKSNQHIGYISYNFHLNDIESLSGFFSIILYFNDNKHEIYDIFDLSLSTDQIFNKLITYCCNKNLLEILQK